MIGSEKKQSIKGIRSSDDEDFDFKVIYTSTASCALLQQIALGRVNLNYASNLSLRILIAEKNGGADKTFIKRCPPTCVLPYHGHLQIIRLLPPCKVFDLPADFAHVLYHINYTHVFSSTRVAWPLRILICAPRLDPERGHCQPFTLGVSIGGSLWTLDRL